MIIDLSGYPSLDGQQWEVEDHILCFNLFVSYECRLIFYRTDRINNGVVVFEFWHKRVEERVHGAS